MTQTRGSSWLLLTSIIFAPSLEATLAGHEHLERVVSKVFLRSRAGVEFLRTARCPALVEPAIARQNFGFKLVDKCDDSAVSIWRNILTVNLEDGSILLGVDDMAKVVSSMKETSLMLAELKKITAPDQVIDAMLREFTKNASDGSTYRRVREQRSAVMIKAIRVDQEGATLEILYVHAITGVVFRFDMYEPIEMKRSQAFDAWQRSLGGGR